METKKFIETRTDCIKFDGTHPDDILFAESSDFDTTAYDNSFDLSKLKSSYPITGKKPIIQLIDSVLDSNFLLFDHKSRIVKQKSFHTSFQPIDNVGSRKFPTHGNQMISVAGLVSDADFSISTLGFAGPYTGKIVDTAIDEAIKSRLPDQDYVINLSLGSFQGNTLHRRKLIKAAVEAGTLVVQAIGNRGVEKPHTNIYDNNNFTVGVTKTRVQVDSSYGLAGPDLLVHLGAEEGPIYYKSTTNSISKKPLQSLGSSGAAAIVSSIAATMMNLCRSNSEGSVVATPAVIKAALCDSANKLKPLPTNTNNASQNSINEAINTKNSFVRCGILNPIAAMEKLLNETCQMPTLEENWVERYLDYKWLVAYNPWLKTEGDPIMARIRRNKIIKPYLAESCHAQGGIIIDHSDTFTPPLGGTFRARCLRGGTKPLKVGFKENINLPIYDPSRYASLVSKTEAE